MLTAFIRAFRTPDLRKKLLFTLGIVALFRFGSSLPAPGISEKNVTYCAGVAAKSPQASIYQIVDLLSGNALKYMSVFALGIMPYITASIILQLLTVVIPRLETLKNEGQAGQAKITSTPGTSRSAWRSCSPPGTSRSPGAERCSPTARRTPTRSSPTRRPSVSRRW